MNLNRVALLVNPNAGNQAWLEHLDDVRQTLAQRFANVDIYKTTSAEHAQQLVDEIHTNVDVLIGAGGDGTIYQLTNALARLEQRPVFAILPCGTANDFSRAIGMAQDPIAALEQIMQMKVEPVDIGFDGQQYFLNFWGIGLITTVSEQVQNKDALGRLSYYISTLQNMNETEPFHVRIQSDTFEYEGEAVMVLVGNSPFTGGLRAFFPNNHLQDGTFDILIIKNSTLPTFLQMFRSRITQLPAEHENVIYHEAKQLYIEATPQQNIDCDGERRYNTPATIKNLQQYLRIIVGNDLTPH
ncbi:diacylglycerol kinase family lipid kinase [Bacillaceae bacterium SIJ1]|uniref:diacylglycerol/lipid kinase family protein n=1 Tax=Litoribacterium kuwaitense TaxID=1398745 RepID=UPI0013EDB327|nr:diacylglycerol kinase family protein [Litoribacterium kuwaitense]NGP45466.1 diacylglycerol kinase family lipid kinase [Litoribacterium kuwaitense]